MSLDQYEVERSLRVQEVEQLRAHAGMERQRVSNSIKDLIAYTNNNLQQDPLVFPKKENNPFKEKRSCVIL